MARQLHLLLLVAWLASAAGRPRERLRKEYDFERDTVIKVPDAVRHVSPADAQASLAKEAAGRGNRVIAMALYGDKKDYLVGAVENAVIVQRDWADWTLRVYHDSAVPRRTLRLLQELNVELVPHAALTEHDNDHAGLLLRYTVLQDTSVTRYLIRDADARLSQRDRHAVDEWIVSGNFFHIVRDYPAHYTEIMGGAWGAVGGLIRPSMLDAVVKSSVEVRFNEDQLFMREFVWPHVRQYALAHDSFYCEELKFKGPAWRPFPTERISRYDFIGNRYEQSNEYAGLKLEVECPAACRAKPEWTLC